MALLIGQLVKDKYFYLPQMGMYWDVFAVKRVANENEDEYCVRVDNLNINLQKLPGAAKNEYFVCVFMLPAQIYALPTRMQSSLAAKTYMMVADPSFKSPDMPAYGPWNPVDFVWKSNTTVLLNQYRDSNEHTAEWLSHRFPVVPENQVKAAPTPANSYNPWATTPPVTPPVTPPADDPEDPTDPGTPSGGLVLHMTCPHCGKKIF